MKTAGTGVVLGTMFIAIALCFGLSAFLTMPLGSSSEMGPGYFPIVLSLLLAAVGCGLIFQRVTPCEGGELPPARSVFFLLAAPIVFGVTVRPFGLLPAVIMAVTMAVLASGSMTFSRGIKVVAAVVAINILIFHVLVGIPVKLINI